MSFLLPDYYLCLLVEVLGRCFSSVRAAFPINLKVVIYEAMTKNSEKDEDLIAITYCYVTQKSVFSIPSKKGRVQSAVHVNKSVNQVFLIH